MAPRVPQIKPGVAGTTAPAFRLSTRATPESFGAGTARAIQQAGGVAVDISKQLQREQDEANEILLTEKAAELDQAINRILYDPDQGYTRKQLSDALSGFKPAKNEFELAASSIEETIQNPDLRARFQLIRFARTNFFDLKSGNHLAREREIWKDKKVDDRIKASSNLAFQNYFDTTFVENELVLQEALSTQRARDIGEDQVSIDNRNFALRQSQFVRNIKQAFAKDDIKAAERMLADEDFVKHLPPETLTWANSRLRHDGRLGLASDRVREVMGVPTNEDLFKEWIRTEDLGEVGFSRRAKELEDQYGDDGEGAGVAKSELRVVYNRLGREQARSDAGFITETDARALAAGSLAGKRQIYTKAAIDNPRTQGVFNQRIEAIDNQMLRAPRVVTGGSLSGGPAVAELSDRGRATRRDKERTRSNFRKQIDLERVNGLPGGEFGGTDGELELRIQLTNLGYTDKEIDEEVAYLRAPRLPEDLLLQAYKNVTGEDLEDPDKRAAWRKRLLSAVVFEEGRAVSVGDIEKRIRFLVTHGFEDEFDELIEGESDEFSDLPPDLDPSDPAYVETVKFIQSDVGMAQELREIKDQDQRDIYVKAANRKFAGFEVFTIKGIGAITPFDEKQRRLKNIRALNDAAVGATMQAAQKRLNVQLSSASMGVSIGQFGESIAQAEAAGINETKRLRQEIRDFVPGAAIPPFMMEVLVRGLTREELNKYFDSLPDQSTDREARINKLRIDATIILTQAISSNSKFGR